MLSTQRISALRLTPRGSKPTMSKRLRIDFENSASAPGRAGAARIEHERADPLRRIRSREPDQGQAE
jgi:hypothetical protein